MKTATAERETSTKHKDGEPKIDTTTDALEILHRDHQKVREMFFQYSQLEEDAEEAKKKLAGKIIKALFVHAKAEEEIVYPAARKAEDTEDMIDEADTEHHVVKFLLTELTKMSPDDDHYDAKITVLCELVDHHVQEEEKDIFHKLEESGIDLDALGKKLLKRKEELETDFPKEVTSMTTSSKKNHSKK